MNEIMSINTATLTNKKLGTQLNTIAKAIATGNASQWKIADAIYTIITGDLFVDDFETEKKLADALGMSRTNLNKMKNASDYHTSIEELHNYTLSKVMEMLVIPKESIVAFLDGYMVTPSDTVKEVREAVSAWKDDNAGDTDTDVVDADTDTDAVDTDTDAVDTETDADTVGKDAPTLTNYELAVEAVDRLEMDELVQLMSYIEQRL